jgi:hypothetical protein
MDQPTPDIAHHPLSDNLLLAGICAVIVALYAWERYNTPETNRLSTTRTLFLFTGAGYVVASLTLFLLLREVVLGPDVLPYLGLEAAQKFIADYFPPSALAALLLTTLLPNTPIVSGADKWLLRRFQTWGRIPQGVRNLADKLTPDALQLGADDIAQLRRWIDTDGDVPDELAKIISADPPDSPRGSLARALRLHLELQKLEAAAPYRTAFRSRRDAWHVIKEDFRVFLAESQAFFVLFEQLAQLEGTVGEGALGKAKRSYRDVCRDVHRDMTEFLAQLLLIVEGSEQRIDSRLQSIGFAPTAEPWPDLPIGPFLFIGVMMIVGMLAVVAVVSPPHAQILPAPVIAILIGTTRTIGLLTAVLPKIRWRNSRPDSRGNPPYLAWLGWAALAGVLSFLIERAIYTVAFGHVLASLDFATCRLTPMAFMSFATSLVISILCDVDLRLGLGWARRVTEGLLCALAMAVAIFICTHLLALSIPTGEQAPFWRPIIISSALGFGCGLFAPYIYRRARDEEPALQMAPSHAI